MSNRIIEMFVKDDCEIKIENLLKDETILGSWCLKSDSGTKSLKLLVKTEESEEIMDKLYKSFSKDPQFRILVYSIEATLPIIEEPEEKKKEKEKEKLESKTLSKLLQRISREELYQDVNEMIGNSYTEMIMLVLSAIVVTVGLIRNNSAIIIGAMVIAPMLGPNVGQAFSLSLGDFNLLFRAVKTNLWRIAVAFIFSVAVGLVLQVDSSIYEIYSRTFLDYGDIILATASGVAASLSLTTGVSNSLIGVMVSVALLPPLATSGLLFGSGYFISSLWAFLLFLVNIVCVNLSCIITFMIQGIEPRHWYKAEKAKQASKKAIIGWLILLVALTILITFIRRQ